MVRGGEMTVLAAGGASDWLGKPAIAWLLGSRRHVVDEGRPELSTSHRARNCQIHERSLAEWRGRRCRADQRVPRHRRRRGGRWAKGGKWSPRRAEQLAGGVMRGGGRSRK